MLFAQRVEDQRRIDAVEELGPEDALHLLQHLVLHPLVALPLALLLVGLRVEAEAVLAPDQVRADVRGHDDDRVAEVDLAAFGVGQVAVVEDLQQHVEDFGVRLLDLVEQDQAVGLAPHRVGQLPAVVVADVARRRADQPRHGVPLHELRHVEPDHVVVRAEHEVRQRAGQLGFAHAGGAEEHEDADRAARILESGAGAAHGFGQRDDRLLLPHDPLVNVLLHVQQPLGFLRRDLHHGDARPHRNDLGDVLGEHIRGVVFALLVEVRLELADPLLELQLAVAQVGGVLVLLLVDRLLFLLADALEADGRLLERGGGVGAADAHARGRLVDQVDRLVRQRAVADVARRHLGRGDQRLVGDRQLVVLLIAILDPAQDLDRLFGARLFDHDRLEAPFQRGVALDVLAVVVERRRADRLQFAPRQRGLENVGRVDRALGRARADQHVQLVDEQHAVARALDLLDDLLQPLLKLAAVLGARHQRADVEREQALALQRLGHVAAGDVLREPLDDGGLAHARLADQHRVVLGAAREDLDDALNFLFAPNHRVERAVARGGGQVEAELVDRRGAVGLARARARAGRLRAALRENAGRLGAHPLEVDAEALQHAGGDALALAHQPEQQVFRADVVVVEPARLVDGQLDHLLGARREADFAQHRAVAAPDDELDSRADLAQLDAEVGEHLGGDAVALAHQAEQQVLGADVVVVEALRLFLRQRQHSAGALGELVESICHDALPCALVASNQPIS